VLLMATLGVADEYEVFVVQSRTQSALVRLPFSSLKWQRARNRIAQHEVTIAADDGGLECCGNFGGLRAWSQMIQIVRDGAIVADGPIVGFHREPDTGNVTIRAMDRSAIMMKRIVAITRIGLQSAGAHFYQLLADAQIGNLAFDPYPLNVPAAVPFLTEFDREYRAERLERVSDCIDELARNTNIFFTCVGDTLYADELDMRHALGIPLLYDSLGHVAKSKARPVLNEATTINIPRVEYDGMDMISTAYVGGSNEGQSGAPIVGQSDYWSGRFVTGLLESGSMSTKAKSQSDVNAEALIRATEQATGVLTVEDILLSPEFGSEGMHGDLSNFLPGAWLDLGYQDTCTFMVPFAEVRYEYRDLVVGGQSVAGSALTPIVADRVSMVRIEQIDGELNDEGVESVRVAVMPTAEWDGTLPTGWRDPGAGED
jgi:hypothetical protein